MPAIAGHSERRHYDAEGGAKAVQRIKRAVDVGMILIYYIGEIQAEYAVGELKQAITIQVQVLLRSGKANLVKIAAPSLAGWALLGVVSFAKSCQAAGAEQCALVS